MDSHERPHKCNACNKSFGGYYNDIYTYICSKIFNIRTLPYINLINSYERPHKCNACNKSFSFQSRNPSATYHSDIYTFICSKIFNTGTLQYSNLIYHIISKAQTRREYVYIYLWSRSASC